MKAVMANVPEHISEWHRRTGADQWDEMWEGVLYIARSPPDAVVEIHSPGDEAYEKLPFYSMVGVREVWIIDRDTRHPELRELIAGEFHLCEPGPEGWITSTVAGIELRAAAGDELEIRVIGRDDTRALLP